MAVGNWKRAWAYQRMCFANREEFSMRSLAFAAADAVNVTWKFNFGPFINGYWIQWDWYQSYTDKINSLIHCDLHQRHTEGENQWKKDFLYELILFWILNVLFLKTIGRFLRQFIADLRTQQDVWFNWLSIDWGWMHRQRSNDTWEKTTMRMMNEKQLAIGNL